MTIPEHADPALRRKIVRLIADRDLKAAARLGDLVNVINGKSDLPETPGPDELAASIIALMAPTLQRIAALEEALEPFKAAYSEHMWHVLVTYGFGELTPSRTNFTIPREAFARAAHVLTPEEGEP